ncbi:hypothetical protein Plhal304r1_c056g0141581 [Plasmopara halstedii]
MRCGISVYTSQHLNYQVLFIFLLSKIECQPPWGELTAFVFSPTSGTSSTKSYTPNQMQTHRIFNGVRVSGVNEEGLDEI